MKAKVIATKYANICVDKLKEHLVSQRVAENDMFRKAAPVNSSRHVGAAAVSVGDWVEVDGDRSPGWNSEGGIAMVIASSINHADVKLYSFHCLQIIMTLNKYLSFKLVKVHTHTQNRARRSTTPSDDSCHAPSRTYGDLAV